MKLLTKNRAENKFALALWRKMNQQIKKKKTESRASQDPGQHQKQKALAENHVKLMACSNLVEEHEL